MRLTVAHTRAEGYKDVVTASRCVTVACGVAIIAWTQLGRVY